MQSEILETIKLISEDKKIPFEFLSKAIEDAFSSVALDFYSSRYDVVVKMDHRTGDINFFSKCIVTNNPSSRNEISIDEAKKVDKNADLNDTVLVPLPEIPLSYNHIRVIKNAILNAIKDYEKEIEFKAFNAIANNVVEGIVKKKNGSNLIVGISPNIGDAIIFSNQLLPTDFYNPGDRITAYLKEVKRSNIDYQAVLSRTAGAFLEVLLAKNVPEVNEGLVSIKSVARFPGSKSKIAIVSNDPRIDAAGACIGPRGSRIQKISQELKGERIDIVFYSSDPIEFTKNALGTVRPTSIGFNEDRSSIVVAVPEDDLKILIGRAGQNIKLISRLVGYNITLITTAEDIEMKKKAFSANVKNLIDVLDVEEAIAELLVSEGLVNEFVIASAEIYKISRIPGFGTEIAEEIKRRAQDFVNERMAKEEAEIERLGITEEFLELPNMSKSVAISLFSSGICDITKLADLSTEEFKQLCPTINENVAGSLIMSARDFVNGSNS